MSLAFEVQQIPVEQAVERTVKQTGWASKYRIYETVVRVVVTRVNVELVSPDGSTVVSRYVIPTRYVETEYTRSTTVFLGVVQVTGATTLPTTAPPATEETRKYQVQPVAGGGQTAIPIHQAI